MKKTIKVLFKSLIVNFTLTNIKLIFGLLCNSKVLIADGIHSLSDLSTDIIAIFGSKFAEKPADYNHPYGHGKLEYLTNLIIGTIILALAISLITTSLISTPTIPNNIVLYVTIFTIIVKYLLANYILKKGKTYKSNILIAAGKESKADVLSSFIVVITYLLSKLSTYSNIFIYIDTLGSIIIGLIILKIAYNLLKDNINSILGEQETDEDYLDKVKNIILENKEIKNIKELNIIKYGHYYQAIITISIDKNTSIEKYYQLENKIKEKLINAKTRISYIKISVNPYMEVKNA